MLEKIIYVIFVINVFYSKSNGIPLPEYNETSWLRSIDSRLSDLKEDQNRHIKLMDGIMMAMAIFNSHETMSARDSKESAIQSLKSDIESLKADNQFFKADFQSLRSELRCQKNYELVKETNTDSLKAAIDQQNTQIIDKAQNQSLREEKSLADISQNCSTAQSNGKYEVLLTKFSKLPFQVVCDTTTQGGGWTIFLRRMDGSVNFTRNWTEYKNGFGNLDGEFFLGLDKIHALTSESRNELLVVLEDFEGEERFEAYDEFAIGDESEQYILRTLGNASGNAGDSLGHNSGSKFSTFDRDNELYWGNCAARHNGAWWFSYVCGYCNLTGRYNDTYSGNGVNWNEFRGFSYSLKRAVMMIRPKI